MTESERKAFRFLGMALAALLVTWAVNAVIDLGALLHDLTHPHP